MGPIEAIKIFGVNTGLTTTGGSMNSLQKIADGMLFGTGLILAAVVFKLLFHVGFCG